MNIFLYSLIGIFTAGLIICLVYKSIVVSFNLFNRYIVFFFESHGWEVEKIRKLSFKEILNGHPFDNEFDMGVLSFYPNMVRVVRIMKDDTTKDLYVLIKFRYFKPCLIIVEDKFEI
jgi:hypothetical protein